METTLTEQEPSVLEYARFYGLCIDFQTVTPPLHEVHSPLDEAVQRELIDSPKTNPITDTAASQVNERLIISKEAALLLKDASVLRQAPADAPSVTESWRRAAALKLDVPILRSNANLQIQELGSTELPDLVKSNLTLWEVDERKDEGLQWPAKYHEYPKQWNERAHSEKWSVSKDVLLFLQDGIRDTWTSEDENEIRQGRMFKNLERPSRYASPPLLPLSPQIAPYVPSSPGNQVVLPSDSTDSVASELKDIGDRIMRDDVLEPLSAEPDSDDILFDYLDPAYFESVQELPHQSAPPLLKRKAEDLKVEGPLTPPMFSDSPEKKLKSVSFPDVLHEFIPNADVPSMVEYDNNLFDFHEYYADSEKPVNKLVEELNDHLTKEQLIADDTTKRIDVPAVDFTLPIAPWVEFSLKSIDKPEGGRSELHAQRLFISRVKHDDLKAYPSWHGISRLERDLPWRIFLSCRSPLILEEKLHGEKESADFLAEVTGNGVATSSTDIWKRDGLRILELEDDDDEELGAADFRDSVETVETAARKRKLEIEEESDQRQGLYYQGMKPDLTSVGEHIPTDDTSHGSRLKSSHRQACKVKTTPPVTTKFDNGLMFGGIFSASAALENFMELHGKQNVKKPENEPHISSQSTTRVTAPREVAASSLAERLDPIRQDSNMQVVSPQDLTAPQSQVSRPLPELPKIPSHLPPCSFIISSTLLQRRSLAREVQKIYEEGDFIERDFNDPRSPSTEADFVISPSTGLILTTLQQIKQRALPGQPDRSPIKQRISHLQSRYERLVVLISEGLSKEVETTGLALLIDDRDKQAIAEFEVFTSSMEAEISNEFVRGGEKYLARAIIKHMATLGLQHGSKDIGDLRLLQEESTWEVFLRRVGLNPFAAQIIIASLKDPLGLFVQSSSSGSLSLSSGSPRAGGLPAFILMPAEERVQRFQVLLGGSRILGRVNSLIDQQWLSAANGFQM